ncbi:acyltransferase [Burkholderia vietnamiensis]|uniref:acyltransferase n=1 Tax=Burkholderia vietnamiensis TaxID=60552 RepID=UPI000A6519D9|nr:acyltransferase family protein [Burkholderia vietnamiensis]MCA8267459.1 acyltransferase family protein [Burkholderia vietnamiensis]
MDRRFDLLRVLACFMVVVVHVSGADTLSFGPNWWAGNLYDSLARACVPIFFMLSGATLLPKAEPLFVFFKKRFIKVIPPLVVWSSFYLWWLWYNGAPVGGVLDWVAAILRGPTMFHLWFFYAIVGIYLFVPAMRRLYQGSTPVEKWLVLALWFMWVCVYPMAHTFRTGAPLEGPSNNPHSIGYFAPYLGYVLLGAVLSERTWRKTTGAIVFVIGISATAILTWARSAYIGTPVDVFYLYLSPTVTVAAVGLFMFFLGIKRGAPSRFLSSMAQYTVAIYGLHAFVIDPVASRIGLSTVSGIGWIDIPLTSACVFVASAVAVHAWHRCKRLAYLFRRRGAHPA